MVDHSKKKHIKLVIKREKNMKSSIKEKKYTKSNIKKKRESSQISRLKELKVLYKALHAEDRRLRDLKRV
jgi:hypothetical protein